MSSDQTGTQELPVRDQLARERTLLANERTLLAYVRTSIMLAVTGGTLLKLYGERWFEATSGWVLLAVGVAVMAFGFRRYQKNVGRVKTIV